MVQPKCGLLSGERQAGVPLGSPSEFCRGWQVTHGGYVVPLVSLACNCCFCTSLSTLVWKWFLLQKLQGWTSLCICIQLLVPLVLKHYFCGEERKGVSGG